MKDRFSDHADSYAKFRPSYPQELFDFLNSITPQKDLAWDCGTGNGQVATLLAQQFKKVIATDISEKQLAKAPNLDNVEYLVSPAEQTSFGDQSFNLITVAQALHWFELPLFFAEAKRVLKKDGILAVWGYNLVRVNPEVDAIVDHFYTEIVGPYWDAERRLVDSEYQGIDFPFEEIPFPSLFIENNWRIEHFIGYLNTWSSVKKFEKENGENPVDRISKELREVWQGEVRVRFPVFGRVMRRA